MSLRGAIGMAVVLMSGITLGVEAKGAEMLVMPGMDMGWASIRALSEDSETTASDNNEDKSWAVIAGSTSMGVEDKDGFCGNTEALEAIGNVLKAKTGSADSVVWCPAGRLEDGAVRRLVEDVELTYELIFYADSADGPIDKFSAAVTDAMSAMTAMFFGDLQLLIAAEFAAQGIQDIVVVNSISAPTVTIHLTEADASSRSSVWVCSLFAACVTSLAFLK